MKIMYKEKHEKHYRKIQPQELKGIQQKIDKFNNKSPYWSITTIIVTRVDIVNDTLYLCKTEFEC